jgi:hypothetical protein
MSRQSVRKEIHTSEIKVNQKDDISDDPSLRETEIIKAETMPNKAWADEMEFNEEPVTIRISRSTEKNAPTSYPFWVQGKGCEVLMNGKWVEMIYIPVNTVVTTKRKYLAVMASAKFDNVTTDVGNPGDGGDVVKNRVHRETSSAVTLSVIEDKNPRGHEWFTSLCRQQLSA